MAVGAGAPYARPEILGRRIKSSEIFRDIHTFIEFPVSPKLLLLLKWGRKRQSEVLPRDLVVAANDERARRADRFLYSHISDDRVARLLLKYRENQFGEFQLKPLNIDLPQIKVERV